MSKDDFDAVIRALSDADDALGDALDRRADAVRKLTEVLREDPDLRFRMPREQDVAARLQESLKSFPRELASPIMRELLSACAAMVAPQKVAMLGDAGGFAHLAGRRHFGSAANFVSMMDTKPVFDAVRDELVDAGIVPFETSTDGAVTATLLALEEYDVRLQGEVELRAGYHVLSTTGTAGDVEKIYGSPASLEICRKSLRAEFPRATLIDIPESDVAAELVAGDHGAAVVGGQLLQELYNLKVVREHIQDEGGTTRYAIIGKAPCSRSGDDRTLVAMAVHDVPGALHATLKPFAERDVNLTRVESRPTDRWGYLFFVEMDGHVSDRPIMTALEELRSLSRHVKVLGSYPK